MISLLMALWLSSAAAVEADPESLQESLECVAFVSRPELNEDRRALLKPASFDPNFLRVDFEGFEFGADPTQVDSNRIIMVIVQNATKISSMSTTGFRPITEEVKGTTLYMQADDLKGVRTFLELSCYVRSRQ